MKYGAFVVCINFFLLLTGCGGDKSETATVAVQPEVMEVEAIAAVKVVTASDGRPVFVIPLVSVFMRGQLEGVQVAADDGIVSIRWIRTGNISGESVEVLSGLEEGEKVVAPYDRDVREGFQVTVKQ